MRQADGILKSVDTLCHSYKLSSNESQIETLNVLLHNLYESRHIYDSIVIFGDGGACDSALMELFNQWLPLYRIRISQNVMRAHVNVTQYDLSSQLHNHFVRFRSLPSSQMLHSSLDINIGGTSEQILRYIAEKGNTAQLTAVENIDTKFALEVLLVIRKQRTCRFSGCTSFPTGQCNARYRWHC